MRGAVEPVGPGFEQHFHPFLGHFIWKSLYRRSRRGVTDTQNHPPKSQTTPPQAHDPMRGAVDPVGPGFEQNFQYFSTFSPICRPFYMKISISTVSEEVPILKTIHLNPKQLHTSIWFHAGGRITRWTRKIRFFVPSPLIGGFPPGLAAGLYYKTAFSWDFLLQNVSKIQHYRQF